MNMKRGHYRLLMASVDKHLAATPSRQAAVAPPSRQAAEQEHNNTVRKAGHITVTIATLTARPDCSIKDFKTLVEEKRGIPPDQQRFMFESQLLDDSRTLEDYNIKHNSIVHLVLRMRGGARGRGRHRLNGNRKNQPFGK
eukprot:g79488.t1